jgi:predicted permease
MTKSILNLETAEYAYETERLFTARVALPESDYPDAEARRRLWEAVLREVRALPGVAVAGLASQLPLAGESRRNVALDGTVYEDVDAMPSLARVVVTPGYFGALGIGVTSGRDFTDLDAEGSDLVTIVNQPMVDRYFDGRSPIGRQIREGAADSLPWLTIVGVVPDLGIGGPLIDAEDFEPAGYYVPLGQSDPPSMSIAALPRTGGALALTSDVRRAVRLADPDLPIFDIWTQADIVDRRTWFFGVFGTLFIAFGAAAMFMASVGLYGVLSFAVSRRTQEMGIRMALGADARDVVGLVARQGATQLSIGLGIGLALAFGLTRVIGLLMYRVDPQDPLVFGGVVVMIALVGVAAGFFPARRATGVDPVEALRYE